MPSFYNGKRFFLTYPQCELSKEQLLTFLRVKGQVKCYTICEEKHADGSGHLHACVEFEQVQRRDKRWLDFEGHHPNKQDPRNWSACKQYCRKEGNYIEDETALFKVDVQWFNLAVEVCKYESKIDWYSECSSRKISFAYAEAAWRELHSDVPTIRESEHPGVLCNALKTFKFDPDLHRCMIMLGPSGCGKTTWAKINMPKPCLFVSHIDDLKSFQIGIHESIIFDDVSFLHYPRTAQISIVDFDNCRSIHCRYGNARIPAGIFKCFTANEPPLLMLDPAIKRRVQVINVK
jgi:hypothetical protein